MDMFWLEYYCFNKNKFFFSRFKKVLKLRLCLEIDLFYVAFSLVNFVKTAVQISASDLKFRV